MYPSMYFFNIPEIVWEISTKLYDKQAANPTNFQNNLKTFINFILRNCIFPIVNIASSWNSKRLIYTKFNIEHVIKLFAHVPLLYPYIHMYIHIDVYGLHTRALRQFRSDVCHGTIPMNYKYFRWNIIRHVELCRRRASDLWRPVQCRT